MNGDVKRRATLALLAVGILAAAGCGGDSQTRGGTVVISAAGDADVLFPPTHRQQQALEITDLLFEKLADIGPAMNTLGDAGYSPRLAQRWVWSADSMSVTFHLDPRARWHDGKSVSATDVKFAFDVYTDPAVGSSTGREISAAVDSLTIVDSLTCTAWFRQRSPERFHSLAYNLKPLPSHLLSSIPRDSLRLSPFTRQPVGNGPYRLVRWDANQRIEVSAVDSFYRGRPVLDRVIWTIVPQGQTAVQRVINGEADFIARLTPDEVREVSAKTDVRTVPVGNNIYGYVIFNVRDGRTNRPHPILGNRELRRALTRALDRSAIVANLLDSLGRPALGPFARIQWSADSTLQQLTFDRAAAEKTLDSLGWKKTGEYRTRNGKTLELTMLASTSSTLRQRMAVLMQEQWRQIGVKLNVEVLEGSSMQERALSGRFDAVTMTLGVGPSPSGIKQSWSTAAIGSPTTLNIGGYSNEKADAALEGAISSTSVDSARALYRELYQTLLDDAPAIWIYEPVIFAAANKRLETGTMRPDAWWTSIPSWRVSGDAGTRADR